MVDDESAQLERLWATAQARGKCFVDFQNDVTADDIELAEREAFRSVEHLKRYTTLGMATDQGKTSNVTGLALLAKHTGRSIAQTGVTTFRPPYTPVAFGALAGHHKGMEFRPTRLPPGHAWARELGASFVETGPWLRPEWFPQPGESGWFDPTCRETRAVRTDVGLIDVSTLGKIDVQGPDALAFIERLYANGMATLAVGKVRYGIMLREDGFMFDDGTVARLAPDRYLITTTTAHAIDVYQHMHLCHQVLWPSLDVQFVSVTDQWAQFAVAGPRSRELLQRVLDTQCDISNAAFPFMAWGEVALRDRTARTAVPHLVLGRTRLRNRGPGTPRRCPDPHAARGGQGPGRHALRARGAQRAARRERPRDRQRTQRRDDRLRPGLRPHGLRQERLHRCGDEPPRAPARSREAAARRASSRSTRRRRYRAACTSCRRARPAPRPTTRAT